MARSSISDDPDDPLTRAIQPPPNESPQSKALRLKEEREAQRISDGIDEDISKQRISERRSKPVKVLLLGQSESGKSTTLKNFQLINSSKAFRAELASWRAVIQLNVVRSIRYILESLEAAQEQSENSSPPQSGTSSPSSPTSRSPSPTAKAPKLVYPPLTTSHLTLKLRLSPLLQIEEPLWRRLMPVDGHFEGHFTTDFPEERSVYSTAPWKNTFGKLLTNTARQSMESSGGIDFEDPRDPGVMLHNCAEDLVALWTDPTVREIIKVRGQRMEDMPGFFLDDLERITALKYVPTDNDVLKARLRTIGVSEHRFKLNAGNMVNHDWRIFDVGGARNLRAAWVPYFDDMNAIIFLAPLSCFDQVLAEDPSINRLEDSILLWKSIVSNNLLKDTELILFLNKCDILRTKLEAGVQFNKWVVSYGDKPNTFEGTSLYMRKKFASIIKQSSPRPRTFYNHFTSVTDQKTTTQILGNVKDMILRQNLELL